MRSGGLREFSKSDLIKVTEAATLKQHAAEQRYRRLLARAWGAALLVAAASATAGALFAWWALR